MLLEGCVSKSTWNRFQQRGICFLMKCAAWLAVTRHPPPTAPLRSPLSRGVASKDGSPPAVAWMPCEHGANGEHCRAGSSVFAASVHLKLHTDFAVLHHFMLYFNARIHRMPPFALCPALSFPLSMTQVGPSYFKKEGPHLKAVSSPGTVP